MQLGGYRGNVRDALSHVNASDPAGVDTFFRRNLPRTGLYDSAGDTGQVALATGVMTSVPIWLRQGDVITNIAVRTGATAGATITNQWFALYDESSSLIGQSADGTSAALAANTTITKPLASAYTVQRTGLYFVGLMVAASTTPTLLGTVAAPAIVTGERALSQASGSSLTTTAPATIATPTAKQFVPYVVLT
ncbi:hypothetical protein AB0M91_19565 [Micromonospora rifamycinica]|uniref:hypothetical protein n=1 Tax=Micromonospora rifamycinica TaxID=291594 RepID=UPI0034160544